MQYLYKDHGKWLPLQAKCYLKRGTRFLSLQSSDIEYTRKVLESIGIPVVADVKRLAFRYNPGGYFTTSWVRRGRRSGQYVLAYDLDIVNDEAIVKSHTLTFENYKDDTVIKLGEFKTKAEAQRAAQKDYQKCNTLH